MAMPGGSPCLFLLSGTALSSGYWEADSPTMLVMGGVSVARGGKFLTLRTF
jgi:hypothetical protein